MGESIDLDTVHGLLHSLKIRMLKGRVETLSVSIKAEGMEDFDVHLFVSHNPKPHLNLVKDQHDNQD